MSARKTQVSLKNAEEREKFNMKEIEKTSIDGWTINPPENSKKVRRWIQTIEEVFEPQNLSGSLQRSDPKEDNQQKLNF